MTTVKMGESKMAVAECSRVFHKGLTETYTSSAMFVKQLTVIAISVVTYFSDLLPSDCYTVESFAGMSLRVLKKDCNDEVALFLIKALFNAFEAFDKKYVRKLVLCFYDGECKLENLLEYISFEYRYHEDGFAMSMESKNRNSVENTVRCTFEDIAVATRKLVQTLLVYFGSLQNVLPSNYDICIKLYYNDAAPEDYQPPGFLSAPEEDDHIALTLAKSYNYDTVTTPFHTMFTRTYVKEETAKMSHEVNPSSNAPVMSQTDSDFNSVSQFARSDTEDDRISINCPCQKNDVWDGIEEIPLIRCHYCNSAQHAACFGICREDAPRLARHCCVACSDREPALTPTDARLASCDHRTRKSLSIVRRVWDWCTQEKSISVENLVVKYAVTVNNAIKILNVLYEAGVIKEKPEPSSDITFYYNIDHEQMNARMPDFFQMQNRELVNRLLMETLSQESHPDPVRDVLGAAETDKLQKSFTIGKVVDAVPSTIVEDSTLKEYKDAIMLNDKNEKLSTDYYKTGKKFGFLKKRKLDENKENETKRKIKKK